MFQAGAVWINCHNMFDAAAGFGGFKQSGFGRDGGKEGLSNSKSDTFEDKQPKYEVICSSTESLFHVRLCNETQGSNTHILTVLGHEGPMYGSMEDPVLLLKMPIN